MTWYVRLLILILRIGILLLRIARLTPRLSLLILFRAMRLLRRFRFLPLLVRALLQFAR